VSGSEDVRSPARLFVAGVSARVRAWLADTSDRSLAQRMAGAAFLIRVVSAAVLYLSQVLLARWMGSFEFGIYVYVWTWVLLIGTMANLGLATAAQRFIPEYAERKAHDLLRGFLAGSRWLVIGIATAIAGVGALGVTLIGHGSTTISSFRSISPASRCRSMRSKACSTASPAPTIGSTWRWCRPISAGHSCSSQSWSWCMSPACRPTPRPR
jgi:Polysaccharide biosynthesis protein